MPKKNGTDQGYQSPKMGKGSGGKGQGGRGREGGSLKGPGGYCVCPSCGEKATHQQGTPCHEQKCPKCGSAMIRE